MKRVFISYTADSEEHRARVLALAHQLRREGVDARMDTFAQRPGDEWRRREIGAADFVLAICTDRYRRSFEGKGRDGSPEEAELIGGVAMQRPERVLPVLLEDGASQFVPLALRSVHAMYLPEQLPQLLRTLGATGEPAPALPARTDAMEAAVPASDPTIKRPERRIANVSLLGSSEFVGRKFELSAIRTALAAPRQGAAGEPLIVIGAAGIGKTALAMQHAYRQQDAYDVLWLVRSQTESMIRLDLALLSRDLGVIAQGISDHDVEVTAALAWLTTHDRWLLIFDEAAGVDVIGPYMPRPLRGHVLVTSRGSDWRDAGKKLVLGSIAREESIDLLLRASGRTDATGADELASWLDGHPLAVKLAAALARDRGVALEVLQKQLAADPAARPSQRLESILATAVEDARQRSPAILALVELLAYLAPHEIPIRLLRENLESLPPELGAAARDDDALARLLDDLVRLGMVTRDDSSLSVHAAVQAAIRTTARSGTAVVLLEAAFAWDADHPETWASAEELLPHVMAAIEDPYAPAAQPRALRRLLARTAACTWKRGEPARAIDYQRRSLALLEAEIASGGTGESEPRLAIASSTLGRPEQRLVLVHAIASPDLPKPRIVPANANASLSQTEPGLVLANALAALGSMLREVGDLAEAAAQLERARVLLASFEGAAETVPVLRELARVLAARGDFAGARTQLERALELDRTLLGAEHLSISITLSELSGVEVAAERIDEAAELLERALSMQRRLLGTDEHPLIAATLKRAAAILERRGDLQGARVRLERSLETYRGVFKTDHHVAIVDVMNDLANVLMRLGDTVGAQRLLEQTLDSQARLFGSAANLNSAAVSCRLARTLVLQGDTAGARRQLERALAALSGPRPVLHATVAEILELLGELDATEGELEAARARYEQALGIRRQLSEPSSTEVMQTTASLAQVLAKLGMPEEAARLMDPVLAFVPAAVEAHVLVAKSEALLAIADVLGLLGRAREAREMLVGVIVALQREAAGDEMTLAHGKLALARVYLQLQDLADARRVAREAHDIIVSVLGRGSSADGVASLLRAEIALLGEEHASAFVLAVRALRSLDGDDDASSREWAARALDLAGRAAIALDRKATAATLLVRSLERRDSLDVREVLFALLEELAAEGSPYDATPAVALLVKRARSWLADRVFANAALESATITNQLQVKLAVTGAAIGEALVSVAAPTIGYGWVLELAPISAEGVTEVRTLAAYARYAGRGRLVLGANTSALPWGTYLLTVRFVDSPRDVWRADVPLSNIESPNPFLAGPPAKGERFFGRTRMLDDLRQLIDATSILLLGPRRSGKTSVLYRLAELCKDTWTVVVVDLHGYSGVDDRVMLRELAGQVARAVGIDSLTEDQPLLALRRALMASRTPRILLLLDEIAILARYPDAALQLRAMSKWEAPTVRVVMAGTSRDLDRLTSSTQRGSSPINELVNRELDQLTRQEAVSLLEQPVIGRYQYESAALERILELGAGRPFFLNALAYLALEIVRMAGTRVVTAGYVEAARLEAASYLARWYRELVGELDDLTRAALPALIDAGGTIAGDHAEALRSAGITVGPRRAMTFDPIFTDWWRRGGNR